MVKHYHVPLLCCYSFFSPLQFDILCISQFQTEDDSLAVETWPVPGVEIVGRGREIHEQKKKRLEQAIKKCHLVSKPTSFLFQIIVKVFQYLYYHRRNFCNLIGLEQWHFCLI